MHYQREGVYEDLDGSDLAQQARQHRLPHPLKPMELHQPFPPHPPATPDTKGDRLSAWDVVYAMNMGMACLITYCIITYLLSGFVDQAANFLGGMWAVVAVVFVCRDTRAHALSAGMARLIATCVSFALCLPYLLLFPFTPVGLAILLGIGTLVMALLRRRDDIVTTGITTTVVHGGCGNEPQRGLAAASAAALRHRRRHRPRGHMQIDRFVSVFLGRAAT